MPEIDPAALRRSRAMLLFVVALFVLPIVVAWWMAVVRPPAGDALLNHGLLVEPPVDVGRSPAARAFRDIALAPSEWALIYLSDGTCEASCLRQIDVLSTIRELLGNDGGRVHVAVLIDSGKVELPRVQAMVDATARAFVARALAERVPAVGASGVVFLDWRGQLMMYFADGSRPGDIKADLKRLLRASAIR